MATIEIYIKNFVQGGNVNTTTTLFQAVPMNTEFSIIDPKVKAEMGKAPTFEFAMDPEHPFYYSIMQMQTLFRVDYVGHTIFRGRALTIDVDMMGRKSIHCEGDFAFLMDTPQPGTKEETRPVISVSNYLQQVINQHNSLCGDQAHRFILGEYPDHYTNQTLTEQRIVPAAEQNNQKFGNSSWNTTMDRFEDLLNSFGGYWRTRYVDEQHVYLDWLDQYFRPMNDTRQPIMVASNLLEFNGTNAVDNIFTAVIPIGKRDSKDLYLTEYWPSISPGHPKVNFITVPEIVSLGIFSDEELSRGQHTKEDYQNATNHYGIIFKIVSFENADSEDKLFSYATDWIKNNYLGSITSYDITALDIASYDPTKDPILCGDEVQIGHPSVGIRNLTVISVDYDLYNPWKSKYKIGSPNNLLNAAYGVANKKKNGKSSGGGISGGPKDGNNGDTPSEAEQDKTYLETQYSIKTDQGVDIELDNNLAFLVHDGHGNKIVGSTTEERQQLLEKMRPVVGEIRKLVSIPNWSENAEDLIEIGDFPKIKAARDAWRQEVQQYAMSIGISQDKAEILTNTKEGTTWLANIIDDKGNLKPPWNIHPNAVQLKQMASNVRQALRGNIVSVAEVAAKGNSVMQVVGDILGENIIGGEGFSYVDSAKQLLLNGGDGGGKFSIDLTGKTVEFDDMEVVRKAVDDHGETLTFGFYDEGNLDGGIMVEKINDDDFTVKIKASKVDLGAYATVGRLEAVEARIDDILAGRITATKIAANVIVADNISTVVTPEGSDVPVGVNVGLHSFKIDGQKQADFLGTADVNFDRAAARREGVNSVYISPSDIIVSSGPDYELNGGSPYYDVEIEASTTSTLFPSLSDTATQSIRVYATEAYAAGRNSVATGIRSIALKDDSAKPPYSNGYLSVTVVATPNSGSVAEATLSVDASNAYTAGRNSVSQRTVKKLAVSGDPTYSANRCTQSVTVTFTDDTTQRNSYTNLDVTEAFMLGYNYGKAEGWTYARQGSGLSGNTVTFPNVSYGVFTSVTAKISGHSYKASKLKLNDVEVKLDYDSTWTSRVHVEYTKSTHADATIAWE